MKLHIPTAEEQAAHENAAFARMRESLAALEARRQKFAVSPFKTYRREILSGYSTAQRLAALTLHLWNGAYPVRLDTLFANADQHHTLIALELMESYATWGENDPDFMALGREIYQRDYANRDEAEGK